MPPAKTAPKRKPLTLERAKAFLKKNAPPKRRHAPGTGMQVSKGLFGVPSLGGQHGDLVKVGAWGIGGAILLASFFVFPVWLSPLGVALFLYGWWRGNGQVKATGALLMGVQLVQALGIVQVATEKVAQIKKEGLFKALASGTTTAPENAANPGGAPTPEQVAAARARAGGR